MPQTGSGSDAGPGGVQTSSGLGIGAVSLLGAGVLDTGAINKR